MISLDVFQSSMCLDEPGKALLVIPETVVDVLDFIKLECYPDSAQYVSGNPAFDVYVFQNTTWANESIRTVSEYSIEVQSVNQVGPYSCLMRNSVGEGEPSNEQSVEILGMF